MDLKEIAQKFSVRSIVILLLVIGSLSLATIDKEFRPLFGHLADIGLGGYLGQMVPRGRNE